VRRRCSQAAPWRHNSHPLSVHYHDAGSALTLAATLEALFSAACFSAPRITPHPQGLSTAAAECADRRARL
jgi:hypothetical protein